MKFLWTTIYVKNLDESIAFYSDLAELRVLSRFAAGPGMEIAFMGNGSEDETLVEFIVDGRTTAAEIGESISIGFAVDSVDVMMGKVKSRGIPIQSGPIDTPTNARFFVIKDPNGLSVQFFQQN